MTAGVKSCSYLFLIPTLENSYVDFIPQNEIIREHNDYNIIEIEEHGAYQTDEIPALWSKCHKSADLKRAETDCFFSHQSNSWALEIQSGKQHNRALMKG
jgi:hypothetical protein